MHQSPTRLGAHERGPSMRATCRVVALVAAAVWSITSSGGGRLAAQTTGPSLVDPTLAVRTVVSGLSQPTSMAFIGADDILVLEKPTGRVRRVIGGTLQ